MKHISGIVNPGDDLTKALSWIPHTQHARRSMGLLEPIRDRLLVANSSTSHIKEVVPSSNQ